MEPLLNFLNHSKCQFELTDLLRQLPSDWPLHRVQRLLSNNTRATVGEKFRSSMGKALSLSQLERVKREQSQSTRKPIHVDKDSVCIICNMQLFGDSKFVWIPSSECYLHDYCFTPSSWMKIWTWNGADSPRMSCQYWIVWMRSDVPLTVVGKEGSGDESGHY